MQDYLQLFADWVTYTIIGLVQGSPLASSVNFFFYDSIKVTLLLAVIVFAVGIVRTNITPQKVKKWVAGRSEGVGNVIAALLGIPTQFCSCSAVPLFIGFAESGQSARDPHCGADRYPALLECSGYDPHHGCPHGQKHGDGHGACVHDGRHRSFGTRDDHPQKSDQDQTAPGFCWNPVCVIFSDGVFV